MTEIQAEKRAVEAAIERHSTDLKRIVSDIDREQSMVEDAEARVSDARSQLESLPSLDPAAFERDQTLRRRQRRLPACALNAKRQNAIAVICRTG